MAVPVKDLELRGLSYFVIEGVNFDSFIQNVSDFQRSGWRTQGGVSIATIDGRTTYLQAVVKNGK